MAIKAAQGHRGVLARRPDRCLRAHVRRAVHRPLQAAGSRREPARRRRQHRHRCADPGSCRRLHRALRDHRGGLAEPGALQQAALRSREGHRTDRALSERPARLCRRPEDARPNRRGGHRIRKAESGVDGLLCARFVSPHALGAAEQGLRHETAGSPVPRRIADVDRCRLGTGRNGRRQLSGLQYDGQQGRAGGGVTGTYRSPKLPDRRRLSSRASRASS